ncbi:hypothetical protein MKK64_15505 [Methylobacterium sp. E-025]|jgi:hypothetical protein|nr:MULTISPECIES: hypothetical protein [unclassified Methylobacterium]MCJ2074499.1 hypothetical protein [Methylobacterium sp. E-016]MCJ2112592.1 hypothetical protein [Methylobacterium sp. E-025]
MSPRRALALAFAVGALGLGLRRAVPVAPVDESYRDVVRYYRALERP